MNQTRTVIIGTNTTTNKMFMIKEGSIAEIQTSTSIIEIRTPELEQGSSRLENRHEWLDAVMAMIRDG